jgi:hypothetical protein
MFNNRTRHRSRRREKPVDHRNPLMDTVSGMLGREAGQSDPFNLRLEIRRPRRSETSKHRKMLGIYYVVDGGRWITTRIPESQPERAKAYLDGVRARKLNEAMAKQLPGQLTFATVLADHLANMHASAKTVRARRTVEAVRVKTVVLNRFLGQMKLADYRHQHSIDVMNAYVDERNAFYDANPTFRRRNSELTAIDFLRHLRSAVMHYPRRRGLFWHLDIHVPAPTQTEPGRWLTRSEVARLLKACRGWKWDHQTGGWHPDQDIRMIKRRRHLSRLIRLGVKTATRHDAMLSMMWGSRFKSACVDIDAEGKGWIHRRGLREIETTKARPSMETIDEVQFLFRGWARQDGYLLADGSFSKNPPEEYLIHRISGGHFGHHLSEQWTRLREDAGLDNQVLIHSLKHTAVSWAYQRGITLSAAEQMFGTTAETLLKHYVHWGVQSCRSGRDEFNDRTTRRKLRARVFFEPKATDRVRLSDRARRSSGSI